VPKLFQLYFTVSCLCNRDVTLLNIIDDSNTFCHWFFKIKKVNLDEILQFIPSVEASIYINPILNRLKEQSVLQLLGHSGIKETELMMPSPDYLSTKLTFKTSLYVDVGDEDLFQRWHFLPLKTLFWLRLSVFGGRWVYLFENLFNPIFQISTKISCF